METSGTAPRPSRIEDDEFVQQLAARVADLEARVQQLEARGSGNAPRHAASGQARSSATSGTGSASPEWTEPYQPVELTVGETWIELHEPSARPQLHRLIRETVAAEGPITLGLTLRRVREAWGLRRAGARVQDVFDQAVRQLVAGGHLVRVGNAVRQDGQDLEFVRVPSEDERSRRAVDEIPDAEIELAMIRTLEGADSSLATDDLTASVARVFGWTRRGTGIQTALDQRVRALLDSGRLVERGDGFVALSEA